MNPYQKTIFPLHNLIDHTKVACFVIEEHVIAS